MNTNQMVKTKGSNLSATAKNQENASNNNNSSNNSAESKSQEVKDNSYSHLHDCSGGICSTNWKPVPHIA